MGPAALCGWSRCCLLGSSSGDRAPPPPPQLRSVTQPRGQVCDGPVRDAPLRCPWRAAGTTVERLPDAAGRSPAPLPAEWRLQAGPDDRAPVILLSANERKHGCRRCGEHGAAQLRNTSRHQLFPAVHQLQVRVGWPGSFRPSWSPLAWAWAPGARRRLPCPGHTQLRPAERGWGTASAQTGCTARSLGQRESGCLLPMVHAAALCSPRISSPPQCRELNQQCRCLQQQVRVWSEHERARAGEWSLGTVLGQDTCCVAAAWLPVKSGSPPAAVGETRPRSHPA